jgi:butyryl-CoA dehydrogenase
MGKALQRVGSATQQAWATGEPVQALANAVPYMQAFGHTVLSWIWLDVAACALERDPAMAQLLTQGKLGAARYFFHYELPKIGAWLGVVESRDATCADFPESAF